MHSIPRKTLSALACRALYLACSVLLGCSDASGVGRLELSVTGAEKPLVIPTGCEPACDQPVVAVSIRYPSLHPPIESIELLQYRIDYALDPLIGVVPYYAGTVDVELKPGETRPLTLVAAGSAQRAAVTRALGAQAAAGQATISFAGYDWENGQVITSSSFSIRFESASKGSQDSDGGTSD